MSRFAGIDHGSKRIGLAISDASGSIASPIGVVALSGSAEQQAIAVAAYLAEYDFDAIVVGLPLNMDDTEGPQVQLVRKFGAVLEQSCGKPVTYWDERLSSLAADELLIPAALTRKKKKRARDPVAAQVLLQSFLDAQRQS